MPDLATMKPMDCPAYQVKAFANAESAQQWLIEMALKEYHFCSMVGTSATNHFSKELEALVWVVVEHNELKAAA
jgi:hypothetical protein